MRRYVAPALLLVAVIGLVLLWRYSALGDAVQLDSLVARAEAMRRQPEVLVLAPLVFVALALALVPIVLLRATTVLAFGPILGPLFALVGGAVAAYIGYEVGRHAGGPLFERFAGPRVEKIRARLHGGGTFAIAALRLVPLGPFTMVNVAFGAARIERRAFLLGTILVMIPGLVVLALAVSIFPSLAEAVLPH